MGVGAGVGVGGVASSRANWLSNASVAEGSFVGAAGADGAGAGVGVGAAGGGAVGAVGSAINYSG